MVLFVRGRRLSNVTPLELFARFGPRWQERRHRKNIILIKWLMAALCRRKAASSPTRERRSLGLKYVELWYLLQT